MSDLIELDVVRFEANAERAARFLRTLANSKRLMILCRLTDGERSVGALQALVGLSQSALSQHLALLREDGVLATRRQGQTIFYRIADPASVKVVRTLGEIFCPAPEERS